MLCSPNLLETQGNTFGTRFLGNTWVTTGEDLRPQTTNFMAGRVSLETAPITR